MKNEKIILGHNSFFGINHADYEKVKKQVISSKIILVK